MKKLMELIVQIKLVWGLFFAGIIIVYTVVNMFLGNTSMEFVAVWQIALLSMILVTIHFLIFGEAILTKLSFKHKVLFHFTLCYFILVIFLNVFSWASIKTITSIGIYTISYSLFYLTVMNSFYMYYKATGEELNSKLAIYKEKRNNK